MPSASRSVASLMVAISVASRRSLGVVKDDAEAQPLARVEPAHPVAHGRAVVAAPSGHRAVTRREDDRCPLLEDDDVAARLRPGSLLDEQDLPSGVVLA